MENNLLIEKLNNWALELRENTADFAVSDEPLALYNAKIHNKWFTKENIIKSINAIADMISEKGAVRMWLEKYSLPTKNPKKIMLILAGNIPAVGFHDVLCTLISGHIAVVKMSSADKHLIPWIFEKSFEFFPEWSEKIIYIDDICKDFDAVIATGSDQSALVFESYFSSKPHLIRNNRSSLAILHNDDNDDDLANLGLDIFMYFGLGCRNVSLVFVPENFDKNRLYNVLLPWKNLDEHNAFANNYAYYKSYFSLSNEILLDGSFYLLRKINTLNAPVAILNFWEYRDISEVVDFINSNKNKIQCVVSSKHEIEKTVKMGKTQFPKIYDYADDIDTMEFLLSI
ncbi:MAG: acyl-CoA reductase [Bacteroidales bacterium]|nr:acyl-CoA reductase [Bacteroidales bacterium]